MKTCPICGSAFSGGAHNRAYCSPRCRRKAFRLKEAQAHSVGNNTPAWSATMLGEYIRAYAEGKLTEPMNFRYAGILPTADAVLIVQNEDNTYTIGPNL